MSERCPIGLQDTADFCSAGTCAPCTIKRQAAEIAALRAALIDLSGTIDALWNDSRFYTADGKAVVLKHSKAICDAQQRARNAMEHPAPKEPSE